MLLRVDFNVPLEGARIADDSRIRASLPTIRELVERGASIIIATHLGRPGGTVVEHLRVEPLAARLSQLLGKLVDVIPGVVGMEPSLSARTIGPGQVMMLENVRFEPGEEANDPDFCRKLAALAECYVDDAFGAAHRAHASTEGVAHLLPSAAGRLMQHEVEVLSQVLNNPNRPLVAVIGGAKISTKVGVLRNLISRVDSLLVGGAMACTLLKANGVGVGSSKVEDELLDEARGILELAGDRLREPVDAVVAAALEEHAPKQIVDVNAIPAGWMMLDVGPKTVEAFGAAVDGAGTVVWNGPLGVYEMAPFRAGTEGLARRVARSQATSVVGGGDLVAALAELGLSDAFTHISTGGGATLEFLEGKELPGIAVLEDGAAARPERDVQPQA